MISVTCKWASVIIAIGVFFGLLSVAGNVHVAEFFWVSKDALNKSAF